MYLKNDGAAYMQGAGRTKVYMGRDVIEEDARLYVETSAQNEYGINQLQELLYKRLHDTSEVKGVRSQLRDKGYIAKTYSFDTRQKHIDDDSYTTLNNIKEALRRQLSQEKR